MAGGDIARGVTVAKNLEATLTQLEQGDGQIVLRQGDGEVRYDVEADGGRCVEIRVRDTRLEVERGVLSVRIEGERVFVSVAAGLVRLRDAAGTQDLVGGDLLRLPRTVEPAPRTAPLSQLGERPLGAPTEVSVVDSGAITQRRPLANAGS